MLAQRLASVAAAARKPAGKGQVRNTSTYRVR